MRIFPEILAFFRSVDDGGWPVEVLLEIEVDRELELICIEIYRSVLRKF